MVTHPGRNVGSRWPLGVEAAHPGDHLASDAGRHPLRHSPAPRRFALILFTKVPLAGFAKTRLGERLGHRTAAALAAALTRSCLAQAHAWLERVRRDEFVEAQVWIFYAVPPASSTSLPEAEAWLDGQVRQPYPDMRVHRQWSPGDAWEADSPSPPDTSPVSLSARLIHAFQRVARQQPPPDYLLVMGSDCPALTAAHLHAATALFTQSPAPDAVLGPALDGGYYLLGVRQPHGDAARWSRTLRAAFGPHQQFSSADVFTRTLASLQHAGLAVQVLPHVLPDVDEVRDLVHLPRSLLESLGVHREKGDESEAKAAPQERGGSASLMPWGVYGRSRSSNQRSPNNGSG